MIEELHKAIRLVDEIPWWVWGVVGVVGFLGTVRLVHRGLGYR